MHRLFYFIFFFSYVYLNHQPAMRMAGCCIMTMKMKITTKEEKSSFFFFWRTKKRERVASLDVCSRVAVYFAANWSPSPEHDCNEVPCRKHSSPFPAFILRWWWPAGIVFLWSRWTCIRVSKELTAKTAFELSSRQGLFDRYLLCYI